MQRLSEIVREADDEGDWQAAGCSSAAQWLAQVSRSEYRTAVRLARTSEALRSLPALEEALGAGVLTLDQVAAAAQFATPASDGELARLCVGKAPSVIALAARMLAPPLLADDGELYERRSLSMTWTRGGRELALSGRLPLEQGVVFEQAIRSIAKHQRALDKHAGGRALEWQHSAADALVTLARDGAGSGPGNPGSGGTGARARGRSGRRGRGRRGRQGRAQAQPDHPDRAPQRARTAAARRRRADQPRDRRAARLRRTPPHPPTARTRPRALTRQALRLLRPTTRTPPPLHPLPIPRLHRPPRARSPPPHARRARRQDRTREPDPALPPPPQPPHDHHIRTSGSPDQPLFQDQNGRAITANQPHAPPG